MFINKIKEIFKSDGDSEPPSQFEEHRYEALTPNNIDDENMNEYFKALKFSLHHQDIRNIAVTGPYGAGKSTVIYSFLRKNSFKYINVSLAGFDMSGREETVVPSTPEVELSILQQILYKENKDSLPDSRIDRIQNRDRRHINSIFWSTLALVLPAAVFSGMIFLSTLIGFFNVPSFFSGFLISHPEIKFFVMVISGVLTVYNFIRVASGVGIFDKKLRLNKIAFLKGEAELSSQEQPSLLNNCLDEIVYFFSKLTYRVVVFEDLDRLGTPEIFIKLREINKIVNNNLSEADPVRFVYAVRDDIFLGADARTKFFDFIVPVIPFMDSRNAFTLLHNKMQDLPQESSACLKNASAYIKDMRCLKNIINEYLVFKEIVDNKSDKIKLFSLVFYKNTFALDYSFIEKRTGVLFSFIHNYRTRLLHSNYFGDLDRELSEITSKIYEVQSERASSAEDLRRDIVNRILPEDLVGRIYICKKLNHSTYQQVSNVNLINNEDAFIDTLSDKEIYFGSNLYHYQNFNASDFEKRKILLQEYYDRKKSTGEIKTELYKNLVQQSERLRRDIKYRNAITLSELVKKMGREAFGKLAEEYISGMDGHDHVTSQEVETLRSDMQYGGLDALYFLLADGHIMQDFMMYRSIFHKGSMSENDNEFIKALGQDLSCRASNEQFYIDDAEKVVPELVTHHRIYHEGAMHHQILAWMLEKNSPQLPEVISVLFTRNPDHILNVFSMLINRFEVPHIFDRFIQHALGTRAHLDAMLDMLNNQTESAEHYRISLAIIANVSPSSASDAEKYHDFAHSLGSGAISHLSAENAMPYMRHILEAGIKFNSLYFPDTETERACARFIANNSLYNINRDTLAVALWSLIEDEEKELGKLIGYPWTASGYSGAEPVREYILNNINTFISECFLTSFENEDVILKILELADVSDEMKQRIVAEKDFILSSLSGIPDTPVSVYNGEEVNFRDLFYAHERVEAGWPSLLDYLKQGYSEAVLAFHLSAHVGIYACTKPEPQSDHDRDVLYAAIVCNNEISDEIYRQVMTLVSVSTSQLDDRLSLRNFVRLINQKKLALDENYDAISARYAASTTDMLEVYVTWFSHNKDEFVEYFEYYLGSNDTNEFFIPMLAAVIKSSFLSAVERAAIVSHYYEEYLQQSIVVPPIDVMALVVHGASPQALKYKFAAVLLRSGRLSRHEAGEIVRELDEPGLHKVFTNTTEATFDVTQPENCLFILTALKDADIIRDFIEREDGKIQVRIRRFAPRLES